MWLYPILLASLSFAEKGGQRGLGFLLVAILHFGLQSCQSIQIAQRGACSLVLDYGRILFAGSRFARCILLSLASLSTLDILVDAAVGQDDALAFLVELDNLEGQLLVQLSLASVFLYLVLGSCEAFYSILQLDNGTLVEHLYDGTLVD